MQLDATVLSRDAADGGLKTSLFSRLHNKLKECNRVFMLTEQVFTVFAINIAPTKVYQYRMHPEINAYPSRRFYEGRLVAAESVLRRPPPPYKLPFGVYKIFDVSGEEQSSGMSRHNTSEVTMVMQLIHKFLSDNPGFG